MNKRLVALWLSAACVVFAMTGSAAGTARARHSAQVRTSARAAAPASGTVYAWGDNSSGELGDGTTTDHHLPAPVSGLPVGDPVTALAAGTGHCLALTTSGAVYAWGSNDAGQLGDGTTTARHLPVLVSGLPGGDPVAAIAAGDAHSLALTTSGAVYAWGDNTSGELGDGTTTERHLPTPVSGLPTGDPVVAIAAGSKHSLALTTSGVLYAWGRNFYGQLGDGTTTNSSVPVAVTGLPGGDPVTAIAAGHNHSLALTTSGALYAWGGNAYGQLGDGTLTTSSVPVAVSGLPNGDPVTAIAAGALHSLALLSNGEVLSWGYNDSGQLGNWSTSDRDVPSNTIGLPYPISNKATAIAAGYYHSVALTANGTLYTWGANGSGQLGNGTTTLSLAAVPIHLPKYDVALAMAGGWDFTLALVSTLQVEPICEPWSVC